MKKFHEKMHQLPRRKRAHLALAYVILTPLTIVSCVCLLQIFFSSF
ncbi:MAG: hypothetical protein HOL80_01845 [Candidatus Magasanikbacteria bacterium]|nr:hypothetical protein [Candidatus Magasanikbacteria bacterium]MBT6294625.1 hypothetical protein [Candidatus Magasanikbacteria bacterium]